MTAAGGAAAARSRLLDVSCAQRMWLRSCPGVMLAKEAPEVLTERMRPLDTDSFEVASVSGATRGKT